MIAFREGEQTLAKYHRHMVTLMFELAPIVFFLCIIIGLAVFAVVWVNDTFAAMRPLIVLCALFFINLFWIALFIILTDFYLDVWIITDKRMITVEQNGLFSRSISEFELSKIQDITVKVHGIIPTMLDYGDVEVSTASEHVDFIFHQVGHPNEVKDVLSRAALAYQVPAPQNSSTMQSPS